MSLTTTVNTPFGAKLMAPASGVVLNDELTDFTTAESVAPFGMASKSQSAEAGRAPRLEHDPDDRG